MSVTEKLMAPGAFNVALDLDLVPNSILNSIQPYDQIIITDGEVDSQEYVDSNMLTSAEYIGVVQQLSIEPEAAQIEGLGLNFYIGTDENKGMPVTDAGRSTEPRVYSGVTIEDFINGSGGQPYGIIRRNEDGSLRAVWPGTITEVTDEKTDLLLNFESPTSTTDTLDETEHKYKLKTFLDGVIDGTEKKFGTKGLNLTATSSYAKVDYHPSFHPSDDDFTYEWWEYRLDPSS